MSQSSVEKKASSEKNYTPGELIVDEGFIEINQGRETITVSVKNGGDRPIQVGSHYHFYEANTFLSFEREKTKGFRLNIASGTAVRFEPGQDREVELVAFGGDRVVYGFRGDVMGELDGDNLGSDNDTSGGSDND